MKLKTLLCLLIAFMAFSCSDDPPTGGEDPIDPPGEEEVEDDPESEVDLTEVMATMDDYFNSVETADPAALKSLLEKVKHVKSVTDGNNGMLFLTMDNGREVGVSLEVVSSGPSQTEEEAKAQDTVIEELTKRFDVETTETQGFMNIAGSLPFSYVQSDATSRPPMSVISDKKPFYKDYTVRDRKLFRRKVLLYSPDPTLRSEDIKRMKRAISRQGEYAGKVKLEYHRLSDYSPNYFRIFSNYDIVVVGCHGNPDGELFLPRNAMTSTAITQWERLEKTRNSGVRRDVMEYEKKEEVDGVTIKKRYSVEGFALNSNFFATHMSDLDNTIIWCVKCYAGELLAEFRTGCIVKNDAADYFGPKGVCLGNDVYNLFDSYFYLLTQGKDSGSAFFETPDKFGKKDDWEKRISGGVKYTREETHKVYYLKVKATGVRRKPNSRAESEDKKADKVVVGLQFRYNTDASGNPTSIGKGGVRLVNLETSEVTYVPVTDMNTDSEKLHRVDNSFAIHEIDVALSDLRPGTRYLYNGYIEDENEILSDQSYEFTAEESDDVIEIYTEEDWNQAAELFKKGDNKADIKIMRDITLNNYRRFDYFYGTLDGNGHTITVVPNKSKYDDDTDDNFLIRSAGSLIHNLTINVAYADGFSLISDFFGTIDNVKFVLTDGNRSSYTYDYGLFVIEDNNGTISNCDFSGGCEKFTIVEQNNHYGNITDCTFDLTGEEYVSYIVVDNNGLLTRLKDNSHVSAFVDTNLGRIHECEFHGNYGEPWIIRHNMFSAIISSCRNYANDANCSSAIVGSSNATLEDIVNYGEGFVICRKANGGTLTRCINRAKKLDYADAGIVEEVYGSVTLSHCENYASIGSQNYLPSTAISGIVNITGGSNETDSIVIENCANYGDIYSDASGFPVSGIVSTMKHYSFNYTFTVRNCVNTGTITYRNDYNRSVRMSQIAVKYEGCTYYLSGNKENGRCVREGKYADLITIE